MQLRRRIFFWLASALALVYWGMGLLFSLLYLNYDQAQLHWIWLDYLWEPPLLAGLLIFLPAWCSLSPVAHFLETPSPTTEQARTTRTEAENLPVRITRPIILSSLLGFLLGSVQLRLAAALPPDEMVKNALLGLPTGMLYALLAYFILSFNLRPVVEQCESLLPEAPRERPRVTLFWKTWVCLLVVGLVPLTVMGLVSYTLSQRQLENSLSELTDERLQTLTHRIHSGQDWRIQEEFQGSEAVAMLTPRGQLRCVRGPELARKLQIDVDSITGSLGSVVLRDDFTRILVWRAFSPDCKLVALVPLYDYTAQLSMALEGVLGAAGATLLVSLGLAWALARHLSSPVATLTRLARRARPQSWPHRIPQLYTDDELGDLGRAFRGMVLELGAAQQKLTSAKVQLAELLQERTSKVHELGTLFSISRSVSSNLDLDRVFGELMNQVRELTKADACSILLIERDELVLKASAGFPSSCTRGASCPELHGWDPAFQFPEEPGVRHWSAHASDFPLTLLQEGFRTVLSVPIILRGTSIGLMHIFDREHREHPRNQVQLLRRVAAQAAVAIENARLYEEKNHVADLLCRALIPDEQLGFVGIEVGHRYIPSKVLSGDYYDVILLGVGRIAIVMADVAGKGPDAAIQTVRAKHVIRSTAMAGYSPGKIMTLLNRLVHEDSDGRMVTVFYAEADLARGTLVYCNAGHEPPLLWNPTLSSSAASPLLEPQSWVALEANELVVGATYPWDYSEQTARIRSGSSLLLYTDGVTEARAPDGSFLGSEVVCELATRHILKHPQGIVDEIYHEVDKFSRGTLSDDLSLLAVRFL